MTTTAEPRPAGLLARLSPSDHQSLIDCGERVTYRVEQEIVSQGGTNGSIYFVLDGLLHVRRKVGKRELLLGRLEPGGFFGEVTLFDPGPATASVRAVSDVILLRLEREQLERFISAAPVGGAALLLGLMEEMATRLRRADNRLSDAIVWGGLLKV